MRNNVTLRMDLAGGLPLVRGDRVQLQQVILNLVMNGIEAMAALTDRSREIIIATQRRESGSVLVSVHDTGAGIESKEFDKIFDAFYTTKAEGLGMGLAISRSIIEEHGGKLSAVPANGIGSTFQFTLPAYREEC